MCNSISQRPPTRFVTLLVTILISFVTLLFLGATVLSR
uniref:Uncharacterized protein n=1 Tax=uncultured bacterium A1Q1_fos_493 TaxID=1256577 RepID=L7VZE7_9BACT|nr:hypothetical protein [uncultured bacterium A1Q1_fos_493]